jgi:hypothetical protein
MPDIFDSEIMSDENKIQDKKTQVRTLYHRLANKTSFKTYILADGLSFKLR